MTMSRISTIMLLAVSLLATSCHRERAGLQTDGGHGGDKAKKMFQGIWIDMDSENIVFKVEGDSIFYPDNTALPAVYKIVADTLIIGNKGLRYPIRKQTDNAFWFTNPAGETIRLKKGDTSNNELAFADDKPQVLTLASVLKKDTVVMYEGERYHCYVAINPTKYKVVRKSFNDDGVEISNIYYDNIIHVSVFHGAEKLYSRDFRKSMFAKFVPKNFLSQAVLNDIDYNKTDKDGIHFNVTLCIPDVASCYLLDANISFAGKMTLEVKEY